MHLCFVIVVYLINRLLFLTCFMDQASKICLNVCLLITFVLGVQNFSGTKELMSSNQSKVSFLKKSTWQPKCYSYEWFLTELQSFYFCTINKDISQNFYKLFIMDVLLENSIFNLLYLYFFLFFMVYTCICNTFLLAFWACVQIWCLVSW